MPHSFIPAALTGTLAIQIADQIGGAIVEDQFIPGERIPEVSLAATFNVSRATVRDALRILESRGLVRILPQRGAQVTLLSTQELRNLFEIRAVLLALASRQAAAHFQSTGADRLRNALAQLKQAVGDAGAYAHASAAIVADVTHLSENEQLAEMIAGFAQRIGRYTRLGLLTRKRRIRSLANWRALAAAIMTGDQDLAEATHRRLALENRDAAIAQIDVRARLEFERTAANSSKHKPRIKK